MTKSTFAKTKAQIKSYQYLFSSGDACTFHAVDGVEGQIFVGAGLNQLSLSINV